jgi:hypothetical protein
MATRVLTDGAPTPALGARADQLGTTTPTDRTTQVTYAGHPLYYYAHEGKNQIRCPAATIAAQPSPGPEPRKPPCRAARSAVIVNCREARRHVELRTYCRGRRSAGRWAEVSLIWPNRDGPKWCAANRLA